MAKRKAAGKASNLNDSNPKYLGVKANHGESVGTGAIIIRQRGARYLAGQNVGVGKDFTLFALTDGVVDFSETKRKSLMELLARKS